MCDHLHTLTYGGATVDETGLCDHIDSMIEENVHIICINRTQPLNRLFWPIPFNPAVKEATNLSGRPVGECRLPVQALSLEQRTLVKNILEKLTI